jgi:hypothetical protein
MANVAKLFPQLFIAKFRHRLQVGCGGAFNSSWKMFAIARYSAIVHQGMS